MPNFVLVRLVGIGPFCLGVASGFVLFCKAAAAKDEKAAEAGSSTLWGCLS